MDIIEELERLKALKEQGVLTEPEYEQQKQIALNKQSAGEKNYKVEVVNHSSLKYLMSVVAICFVLYLIVITAFPKSIQCKEGVSAQACACVQHTISQNVSFIEKVRILLVGASEEELNMYINIDDSLGCAMLGILTDYQERD